MSWTTPASVSRRHAAFPERFQTNQSDGVYGCISLWNDLSQEVEMTKIMKNKQSIKTEFLTSTPRRMWQKSLLQSLPPPPLCARRSPTKGQRLSPRRGQRCPVYGSFRLLGKASQGHLPFFSNWFLPCCDGETNKCQKKLRVAKEENNRKEYISKYQKNWSVDIGGASYVCRKVYKFWNRPYSSQSP